ncbi:GNAT family N-acetyltransferase [Burkholderia pseudomallei]|uniref:GNAT family N-acetyltransferase n=1 Tax=Burkholderia pseudomallei TaxID=28450 RepID=UPI0009786FB3|nr:GNAT family N-acetyltransferase [Burkholderia pseudomallei]
MTTAERLEYRPMRERDIGAFYDVRFSVTENRIHPHHMGVGRELLERAVKWLRDNGVDRVTLVTDPGSRADGFYQHLGWQRGALDEYGCQVVFSKSLEE